MLICQQKQAGDFNDICIQVTLDLRDRYVPRGTALIKIRVYQTSNSHNASGAIFKNAVRPNRVKSNKSRKSRKL